MNQYLIEAKAQGEALHKCLNRYLNQPNESLDKILGLYHERKFKRIIFAGMGSSYCAPFSVADYLTAKGIPSLVINAYEFSQYQMSLLTEDTLLVVISKSGSTREVVELVKKAPKCSAVVSIVNQEDSLLAKEADICLYMSAGPEKLVASKSYVNTLAILQILAASLVGDLDDEFKEQMYGIVNWSAEFLEELGTEIAPILEFIKGTESYDFLGDGPAKSSAYQAGCIFREGSMLLASTISCADFLHGWNFSVHPNHTAVIFDPRGEKDSIEEKACRDIIKRGGKVILVTGTQRKEEDSLLVIRHPELPDHLAPIAQIIPCTILMGWLIEQNPNIDY